MDLIKILKLKKALHAFGEATAENGVVFPWNGDLTVGSEIFVYDEMGEPVMPMDGEYIIEGNKVKVVNGKVTEMETVETTEPMPTEGDMACDPKKKKMEGEEMMPTEPLETTVNAEVEALKNENEALKKSIEEKDAMIADLNSKVDELTTKLMNPVDEPAENQVKDTSKMSSANGKTMLQMARERMK